MQRIWNAARRARASLFPDPNAQRDVAVRVGALETAVGYLLDPAPYTVPDEDRILHFNGQRARADLFTAVLRALDCESIVETGTYLGNTTKYMADTSLPVYSCESSPVFFAIAKKELARKPNVDLFLGDSRAFLGHLIARGVHERRSFLYLDAHWNQDLPLVEELEIIARSWSEFVLMIDDFQVPHDDGYGFDDYGPGKRFTLRDFGTRFRTQRLGAVLPTSRVR